jgi:hypothetical protein
MKKLILSLVVALLTTAMSAQTEKLWEQILLWLQ